MREGIRPPKFADKFHRLDFDANPMPVISLYPVPEPQEPAALALTLCGLDCKPRIIAWPHCAHVPRVPMRAPLICSIFNWAEEVEWEGVRLCDFLDHVGLATPPGSYVAFYSRDGSYFEGMPAAIARDPRALLATGLNGRPLPLEHGGPLRLVAPFLQGYKSVKWLGAIRVFQHDPVGIKRLLGQSKTGLLGRAWRERYRLEQPEGADGRTI